MSEFRQNILTKEWVIIAPERAKRPEDFSKNKKKKPKLPKFSKICPFCPGNEDKTPSPVFEKSQNSKWNIRVVPNKFAALQKDADPVRGKDGKYLKAGGYGVAEVIIETPVHNKTIATMNHEEVVNIIRAYRKRYREIAQITDINLITVFRNHGINAGTSLEHPHSQIIATPIVPPHVREPVYQARMAYDSHGTCIYCDILKEEIRKKERIIYDNDYYISFAPYASNSPYECRIVPKIHNCALGDIEDHEIDDFANILRIVLKKLYIGLNDPDYNIVIRSAPTDDVNVKHYHWYVVIIPKITTPAGFEIGSGIYINIIPPESAAHYLKNIDVQ